MVLSVAVGTIGQDGEVGSKVEKARGEITADIEETKGETKARLEGSKGSDAKAGMERANENLKGTTERKGYRFHYSRIQ